MNKLQNGEVNLVILTPGRSGSGARGEKKKGGGGSRFDYVEFLELIVVLNATAGWESVYST